MVENVEVDNSKPKKDCTIAESGTIAVDEPFNVEKDGVEWKTGGRVPKINQVIENKILPAFVL